jgi:hypothetical protein
MNPRDPRDATWLELMMMVALAIVVIGLIDWVART